MVKRADHLNADDDQSCDIDSGRLHVRDGVERESDSDSESDRIRADIDRTRAQMDETVDELQHRMSLDYLARSGVAMARDGAVAGARKLGTMVRDHPLPTAVIAGGLVWMILRKTARPHNGSDAYSARTSDAHGDEHSRVGQAVHSATEALKHGAHRAGEAVKEGSQTVGHSIAATTGHISTYARDKASHIGHQIQHGAQRGGEMFVHTMERHPLPVVAAFFTLGLAAGLAVPATRKEDQIFGGVKDDLVDRARSVGAQVLSKGEDVARCAVDAIDETVGRTSETSARVSGEVDRD